MGDKAVRSSQPNTCPCGNGRYISCCKAYHDGIAFADTAEKLMRSRYSAYALAKVSYLYDTTHPSSRHSGLKEAIADWANSAKFLQLTSKRTEQGKKTDKRGIVEFVATYNQGAIMQQRHEVSLFEKVKKRWYYVGAVEE